MSPQSFSDGKANASLLPLDHAHMQTFKVVPGCKYDGKITSLSKGQRPTQQPRLAIIHSTRAYITPAWPQTRPDFYHQPFLVRHIKAACTYTPLRPPAPTHFACPFPVFVVDAACSPHTATPPAPPRPAPPRPTPPHPTPSRPPRAPPTRLLELVEFGRFPVVPSPPLHEAQLAPRDSVTGVLARPLNLLPHGDQIVASALDAILEHRNLAPVEPLRPIDERLHRA